MSWISSNNATNKQNSKNDLSFYHGFSKTPVEPTSTGTAATTLANASTKGGHTVIGTEVWAEEIPWFGLVASRAAAVTRLSGLTKLNDLVKVDGEGGKVYKYKGADDATFTEDTWADFWEEITLTNGMELKNRHNQPVLRYYLNQPMQTLTTTNNASIDSKGYATRLFVNESDHTGQTSGGSVVSQFAAGTDNIKNGIPSVELNPKLYYNTTEKIAGTHYYDYNVSGTILWNENVASRSVKISCFRYIGKTVTAKTAEIESTIEDLKIAAGAGITVSDGTNSKKGVTTLTLGGSNGVTVTVNETTGAVTFGVNTSTIATTASVTAISERISAAASDISANSEKLVTGGAVYDYVTGATLTSADDAIQSATDEDANKLVTAAQVKEYVTENAQVTVTDGTTDVTATGFEFTGSTGTDVSITAALEEVTGADDKKTGKVTYSATLSKATVDSTTGTITNGDLSVSATDAKTIADKAIEAAVEEGEIIDSRISDVLSANTAALNTDNTIKSGDESKFVTASDADKLADKAITDSLAGDADGTIGKAISDAVGAIVIPGVEASDPAKGFGFEVGTNPNTSSHYIHLATATYTPAAGESDAYWFKQGYLVTGSTVETFVDAEVGKVASALTTLENKVNAYHEAGVSYKVHTGTELPDLTIAENIETYKNVILLVPTTAHPDDIPDLDDTEAMSGGYIEYLCVKTGETTYDWEKIGTTEADLAGYARFIPSTNKVDNHTSPVYASISSDGYLTLGIDSATSDKLGVSKMFSGNYWELSSATDTAVSTLTASEMFTDISTNLNSKADANNVVNSINGRKGAVNLCVHNYFEGDKSEEGSTESPELVPVTNHANLWGMGCYSTDTDEDNIVIFDSFVGISESYLNTANLPSNAVSVENNFVYNADGKVITTIRPERMVTGFRANTGLQSWIGDLSNLTTDTLDGDEVSTFYNCTALTTFIGDLSSLTNGSHMFALSSTREGTDLKTFISDLSSLTDGYRMFYNRNNLEVFDAELSSLMGGYDMFSGTNLSLESVENIADSINEHEGQITITWSTLPAESERQALVDELSRIVDKGWTLNTNSELLSLFDSEKYQTGETTVQPLDLESEPQTVYYVVKK